MNTTQNLNLGKPLVSEKYDISVFNSNADKIDAAVKALQDKTATAGTDRAGIVMLTDSISSDSTTTAATANSVKQVNDKIEAKVDKVTGKNLSSNDLTDDLKANYDAAFGHSISEHARIDATLTQSSSSNGSIRINGSETVVYTHPASHSAGMITEDPAHRFVTDKEKSSYADKYTKNEVDNKLAALETNIDWKESVGTFSDIAAAYPNPQDGWTVNVKDTDYTYRYNGSAWVTISANAIPKATSTVDGLLSKEDKTNLDDANVKKHTHSNKAVLDGITAENVQTWNNAADNNALTLEKYIRSDKHAKIYNNFDVYAKGTTANPLLKIRPDRIDIFKKDGDGTNGWSLITFGKNITLDGKHYNDVVQFNVEEVRLKTGNLDLSSMAGGQGGKISARSLFLKGMEEVSYDSQIYILPANTSSWASYPIFYQNTNHCILGFTKCTYTNGVTPDVRINGFGLDISGDIHLHSAGANHKINIGVNNNEIIEMYTDADNNHSIKIRTNDSGANIVFADTTLLLNANTFFDYQRGDAYIWGTKDTVAQKNIMHSYPVHRILAALIRKTNLSTTDF